MVTRFYYIMKLYADQNLLFLKPTWKWTSEMKYTTTNIFPIKFVYLCLFRMMQHLAQEIGLHIFQIERTPSLFSRNEQ